MDEQIETPPADAVAVMGLWHLGSVYSACFADLGYNVVGIDSDKNVVGSLNEAVPTVDEPGLSALMRKNMAAGRLRYSDRLQEVGASRHLVLAMDTPLDDFDRPDLAPLFALCKKVAKYVRSGTNVMVSSQVPVGTCDEIFRVMHLKGRATIAYVPENLRLGSAIESFMHPPMVAVGSDTNEGRASAVALFEPLHAEVITMGLRSAEMVKHVLNSYLAVNVSFGNEVSALCHALGIDPTEVIRTIMKDPRVGPKAPLWPGPPFSGGTLARDLETLRRFGKTAKVKTHVLDGVARANIWHKNEIIKVVASSMRGRVKGAKVAILGLTYKPGTNTLRRSLALETATKLHRMGITVQAHDPLVKQAPHAPFVRILPTAYDAVHGAKIILVFTGWPEFGSLDYARIKSEVKNPLVIDLPRILDKKKAEAAGLRMVEV